MDRCWRPGSSGTHRFSRVPQDDYTAADRAAPTLIRCLPDGLNLSKKSSKVNQDCTICHSCREAVTGSAVLKQRTNRVKWRTFGGPFDAALHHRREAVRYETVVGFVSAIVEAARGWQPVRSTL